MESPQSVDVLLVNLHSVRNQWVLHPPLGLCYLAAVLERDGYSVQILDANTRPGLPGPALLRAIEAIRPSLVGISLFTPDLGTLGTLLPGLRMLQRQGGFGHLVIGGHHPSYHPEIIEEVGLDWGVMWDGEEALRQLCDALLRGRGDPEQIPGVISNVGGRSRINHHRLTPDLDALPLPARHLLDNDAYFNPMSSHRIGSAITARGCPYSCSFCSGATETSKLSMRYRHVDRVLDELKECRDRHGLEYIEFVDETFTLNRRLTLDLCDGIAALGLRWGCQTRADLVDKELLAAMGRAGCDKVAFGIDASTERVRVSVAGKRIGDDRFRDCFRWTRDAGIKSVANIIFGFPGERPYEILRTARFVQSLEPTFANFQPLFIYPATEIYERALAAGKIDRGYWSRMVTEGQDMVPIYEQPEFGLDVATLKAYGRRFLWGFYLRPTQIVRLLERDHSPRDALNYARIAAGMYRYYFRDAQA